MSRLFYHTCQDNAGNLLFDVSGTMRLAGTGTLATIYGDEALTVILPNPMTNHPSYGSFKCFLGAGDYDFYMAKSGYTFETLTGVQGHGTLAQQDASTVVITGGSAVLSTMTVDTPTLIVDNSIHSVGMGATPTAAAKLYVVGNTWLSGPTGIGRGPASGVNLFLGYRKADTYPLIIQPSDSDTGPLAAVLFNNLAGAAVGSITTTATATAYNTASDARLKHAVTALTGELEVVQALRPVAFRWNSDGSRGYGFIASEVQQVLPDANIITGTPAATNEDGTINPQMIDHSKLVPWLVGALKTLAARVAVLEDALGV